MNASWTAASEDMYKATQEQQPGAQQSGADDAQQQQQNAGTGDNVTDVPYEEVK